MRESTRARPRGARAFRNALEMRDAEATSVKCGGGKGSEWRRRIAPPRNNAAAVRRFNFCSSEREGRAAGRGGERRDGYCESREYIAIVSRAFARRFRFFAPHAFDARAFITVSSSRASPSFSLSLSLSLSAEMETTLQKYGASFALCRFGCPRASANKLEQPEAREFVNKLVESRR